MQHLNALNQLIKSNAHWLQIGKEQREVWLEDTKVEAGSNELTEQGLHYLDYQYRLCASIEDLQADKGQAVIVLIHHFANSLGDDFKGALEIEVDRSGDRTVDIEITMQVNDPIYLTEVENSPIEFSGKCWGFGDGGLIFGEFAKALNVNEQD